LLFTRVASPRTLSLATIPACLVKGGRSASSYPLLSFTLRLRKPCGCADRYRKDASLRLLQPTPRNEHPPDRSIPGCALAFFRLAPARRLAPAPARSPTHPGPMASRTQGLGPLNRLPDEPPSGASLDGEPPASASTATLTCASGVWAPGSHGHPTPRSPGGASIVAPLRRASRSGRFQPRTEHAT